MAFAKLDERPARTDLTSREIAKLLGGFFGALLQMTDVDEIATAVQWWHQTPEAWDGLRATKRQIEEANEVIESRSS
jgi:hypothetical protein